MIVKNLLESKCVVCPNDGFISHRYLLENDNMGFAMTRTTIMPNGEQYWHYKNHMEACFCIKGHGRLQNVETGEEFKIEPDTMYALDKNDAHIFEAYEEVILICVFNPPLKGNEIHEKDGSYEL